MIQENMRDNDYISRALEVSIHVGLVILLTAGCLYVLRPFLPLIAWGIIISIAVYPAYRRLQVVVGGRGGLAAVICTAILLAILILPVTLLTGSLVGGFQSLAARLKEGTPIIQPPPARVGTWPIVGAPLKSAWDLASTNLAAALHNFTPYIKAAIPELLTASGRIGLAVLQSMLSIVVAGVLLAHGTSGVKLVGSFASRLFGEQGPELQQLAGSTIRNVTTGIIGVAFIQSVFASLGFLVIGLPGAGLWAVMFLIAAILQLGVVVLIPAVIYMFTIASTTKAVGFLVWCVIVGVMDNVLKPLLLGRGGSVPMIVVFAGTIGGFAALGPIGLFLGAILLSVGYKLFLAWIERTGQTSSTSRISERRSVPAPWKSLEQ